MIFGVFQKMGTNVQNIRELVNVMPHDSLFLEIISVVPLPSTDLNHLKKSVKRVYSEFLSKLNTENS